MWWLGLLKKLALARLAQTGIAGQVGAHYLGGMGQQKEESPLMNRLWTYSEDEGIPGMDLPERGQSLPYNQQYLNRLPLSQDWNQPESFWDVFFRALMNTRR